MVGNTVYFTKTVEDNNQQHKQQNSFSFTTFSLDGPWDLQLQYLIIVFDFRYIGTLAVRRKDILWSRIEDRISCPGAGYPAPGQIIQNTDFVSLPPVRLTFPSDYCTVQTNEEIQTHEKNTQHTFILHRHHYSSSSGLCDAMPIRCTLPC